MDNTKRDEKRYVTLQALAKFRQVRKILGEAAQSQRLSNELLASSLDKSEIVELSECRTKVRRKVKLEVCVTQNCVFSIKSSYSCCFRCAGAATGTVSVDIRRAERTP